MLRAVCLLLSRLSSMKGIYIASGYIDYVVTAFPALRGCGILEPKAAGVEYTEYLFLIASGVDLDRPR